MKTMRIEAVAMALLLAGGLLAADAAICTWSNAGGTGLWSTPANWSGGVVPEPGDDVVFDGAVSQAACSANVVTNNLASLKLLNGYAGTVAFAVKAVEGAQQLNLSGALEAHSGNLVFAGDTAAIVAQVQDLGLERGLVNAGAGTGHGDTTTEQKGAHCRRSNQPPLHLLRHCHRITTAEKDDSHAPDSPPVAAPVVDRG